MINWFLCKFIGHKLTYLYTLEGLFSGRRKRVFLCTRCGIEVKRDAN